MNHLGRLSDLLLVAKTASNPDDLMELSEQERDILRQALSIIGRLRWQGKSEQDRKAHSEMMLAARESSPKWTKKNRSAIGRKAAKARWEKSENVGKADLRIPTGS